MSNKKIEKNSSETLTGIITPVRWDGDQITAVALSATDDEEYLIENGDKFIDLVQKSIEATGRVRRDKKSFKTIFIKRFDIL